MTGPIHLIMKKFLFLSSLLLLTNSIFAQTTGILEDGYYRVRNLASSRYIYVYDNTGKINIATTSADMGAIELHKDANRRISDPGSIIYVKYVYEKEGNKKYDLTSQGTGVHQIIGYYVQLYENTDKTYYVYAEGFYLCDSETSSREFGYLGIGGKGNYRKWEALKLNDTDNYFGLAPTIQLNGKYYQPFYAAFPFTLSEGMKAYYISKVYPTAAILSEITGTVPASTPVFIECCSANTEDNKLNLQMQDATAISGNKLKGVYFNNPDRLKSKDARTAYDASTMRVLAVKDGKLVYTTDSSLDYLPANQSYLKVPAGTAETLTVMTEEEYKALAGATGISLNKTSLSLRETETAQLTATVTPEDAADRSVTWSSSDNSTATVSSEGVVTAIKAGTATITATTNDGSNLKATCTVKVSIMPVSSITLNLTEKTLEEGETVNLTATVQPANASNKTLTWSSSDESVATVNANGTVTAIKAGTATITVKATDGSNASASCTVTVKASVVLVEGITLNVTEQTLTEGETLALTANVTPENATNKTLTWTSSDETVATVDANGNVTAVKEGTATITVKATDGSEVSASCIITVKAPVVLVESIALNVTEQTLTEGETLALTATVQPANVSNKTLSWTSSDETVATVDANGLVTAVKEGTATITVKATDGSNALAQCIITVIAPVVLVESIALNVTEQTLTEGETLALTASVTPENATNKTLTWTSSNESVATVDANGLVTAVKEGTATITVKATDGSEVSASCVVTVKAPVVLVEGIALNVTEQTLTEGETLALTATVTPENVTNKALAWTSSNESVATVDANGNVTAVKEGTATITVKATEGSNASAQCIITVKAPVVLVDGITLNVTEQTLTEGETLALTATVTPENVTNKVLVWTSSDESVATVDANGTVTAVKEGTATITVKATDGSNVSAQCAITVKAPVVLVEGITLNMTEQTLSAGETLALTATVLPENASNKTLAWTSSDESVATVDANGLVTAVKEGTATITVKATDGSEVSASCTINVSTSFIFVSKIRLEQMQVNMNIGETATLVVKIEPANATNQEIAWRSSDPTIATVENGVVTAIKAGIIYVSVSTTDGSGLSDVCIVSIKDGSAISSISASQNDKIIYDLQGRKVNSMAKKGVYVIDGKKVVVK